jgi:acyl-coenzyme A synthetase/AMP-(fatty) acid ligase
VLDNVDAVLTDELSVFEFANFYKNKKSNNLALIKTDNREVSNIQESFESLKAFDMECDKLTITLMTSGSTGVPKEVTHNLTHMLDNAKVIANEIFSSFKLHKLPIVLATVPLFHSFGLEVRFFLSLYKGFRVFEEKFTYEEQFTLVNDFDFDKIIVSSPAFLKRVMLLNIFKHNTLTISAGGAISDLVIENVKKSFGKNIFEIFGSTETGFMAGRFVENQASLWRCPVESNFYVASEDFTIVDKGIGVLVIDSPYISDDIKKDVVLADSRKIRAFVSEDLVELNNGTLKLLGRIGRVIKIEDNRVSLDYLQSQLIKHPYIKDCALVPLNLPNRQYLQGMIVLTEEGNNQYLKLGSGRFIISLRSTLKDYVLPICIPRKFEMVENLPQLPNGKIAYKEIIRMLQKNEIS